MGQPMKKGVALLILLGAAAILPLALEARFLVRREAVRSLTDEKASELGRHFIVGYDHVEEVLPLAEKGLIGGVFVGRRNVSTLRRDIAQLQAARRASGLPPLLVAADQEGGLVAHLSPPLPKQEPLSDLVGLPPGDRARAAWRYGYEQGLGLAALGVSVDFSPVVDLKREASFRDRHSFIARRAIAADAILAGEIAQAYAEGLRSAGIQPVAKHFPGLGRAIGDTHVERARITASLAEMETQDWLPFHKLLSDGAAFVMVGHAILEAVDPGHPASQSHAIIEDLLRRQWGYDGIVITDDLTMSAVRDHDFCRGVADSLDAGADFLLVAYDGEQYYEAMECALRAKLDGVMLARSRARMARLGL
jgi:beta-N-acetylhexosaminidase